MTSILPPFPRFVMTIFEPISLIAGAVAPFVSPEWFVAEQISGSLVAPLTDNSKMVAYQLGNIYLLLALAGVAVLYTTTEAKVVRNYTIALWIVDITHVGVTAYGLGLQRTLDVARWNAMTWGNVGVTVFLCCTRSLYLLGIFGPDRGLDLAGSSSKKSQ